jgi:enterochelin esterase-like enzyme
MRLFIYSYLLICSLLFLACVDLSSNDPNPTVEENTCAGEGIIKCVLKSGMVVDVSLPPNYSDTVKYPIMFLNDGESVFSANGLNAKFIIDNLIKTESIEPIITVAIYSQGRRNNLYIPYSDEWIVRNWGPYKSESEIYASLIINDLIPFLETQFSLDNEEVGIMGYSLGGLVSTWMGLKYPEYIKYSASLSGSFWVADYQIFNEVKETGYDIENKFWFDIGATTGEWNYYVPLYSALDTAGVKPGEQSFYYEDKGARHTVSDWRKRLDLPLKLFFPPNEPTKEKMDVVLQCIQSAQNPERKFKRMNPIITFSNNAKYSLAHTAKYTLRSGNGQLGSEGSFLNDSGEELNVLVEYLDFSEEVVIPENYCQ